MSDSEIRLQINKDLISQRFTELPKSIDHGSTRLQIDSQFETLIGAILDPIERYTNKSENITGHEVNRVLTEITQDFTPFSQSLLGEVARVKGIAEISCQTWFGPQSVGKGALGDTVQWLYNVFNLPQPEVSEYVKSILKKYDNPEENYNYISNLVTSIEPELDPVLRSLFSVFISDTSDTVKIGTDGIFRPRGTGQPNPRYLPYIQQEKATRILTDSGEMVSDSWTNLLATIELARSLAYGAKMVDLDVWPRTIPQIQYLQSSLTTAVAASIDIKHIPLHIEPFTERTTQLIEQNRELGIEAYSEIGNLIKLIAKHPNEFNIRAEDLDIYSKIGIDVQDEEKVCSQIELIKTIGSNTAREIASTVGDAILEHLQSSNGIKNEIVKGIGTSINTLLFRVSNRIRTQARPDDLKLGVYLTRLGTYYEETGIVPIKMGAKILPAGGTYEEAIEAQLKAMVLQIDANYNFNTNTYKQFAALTRALYLIRVSK